MAFLWRRFHNNKCANHANYTFSVKTTDSRFLVFRRALLSWSVFAHVAPSRTLYGRGFKVLWRLCGDFVACKRGVRRQPFLTPLYIHRYNYAHTNNIQQILGEKFCNLIKFALQHYHYVLYTMCVSWNVTCTFSHTGPTGYIRRVSCTTMSRYAMSWTASYMELSYIVQ